MEPMSRIRINLKNRELELEGPEAFIEKYQATIDQFIEKLSQDEANGLNIPSKSNDSFEPGLQIDQNNSNALETDFVLPDSFGEFYNHFPRTLKVVDKMLIAAFFVQSKNEDRLFTPAQAAELLNEQSVNITNPNAFITALQKTGKLFKHAGKFRVHERGIEYIKVIYNQ